MKNTSLIHIIEPDFQNVDSRGKLIQLVRKGYMQINYIESVGEAIRGTHYHKLNKEAFYVISGTFDVDVWTIDKNTLSIIESSFETMSFRAGDMFYIDPYTLHVFRYHTDSSLISMYDKGVENGEDGMDMYRPCEPLPNVNTRRI